MDLNRVVENGDRMVGSRYSDWLQNLMNVFIGLFRWYGLTANVSKSRTLKCQLVALRLGMSGMRTAIMKLKVSQELASVDHNPRLLVFLDLRKTYDNVYRGRLIWTLEGYGAGPRLYELLAMFWVHQKVVPQQNGYHGPTFPATRGTNQGGLVSPMLFNAIIDNAIR